MPGAEFARARVASRFFNHLYDRAPRGSVTTLNGPTGQDADTWNNPAAPTAADAGAPAIVPNIACHFIDAGSYVQSGQGLIQVSDPTLVVAWDDPLNVGDDVQNVRDKSGTVLMAYARVESQLHHAPSGPPIWRFMSLFQAESD